MKPSMNIFQLILLPKEIDYYKDNPNFVIKDDFLLFEKTEELIPGDIVFYYNLPQYDKIEGLYKCLDTRIHYVWFPNNGITMTDYSFANMLLREYEKQLNSGGLQKPFGY